MLTINGYMLAMEEVNRGVENVIRNYFMIFITHCILSLTYLLFSFLISKTDKNLRYFFYQRIFLFPIYFVSGITLLHSLHVCGSEKRFFFYIILLFYFYSKLNNLWKKIVLLQFCLLICFKAFFLILYSVKRYKHL